MTDFSSGEASENEHRGANNNNNLVEEGDNVDDDDVPEEAEISLTTLKGMQRDWDDLQKVDKPTAEDNAFIASDDEAPPPNDDDYNRQESEDSSDDESDDESSNEKNSSSHENKSDNEKKENKAKDLDSNAVETDNKASAQPDPQSVDCKSTFL